MTSPPFLQSRNLFLSFPWFLNCFRPSRLKHVPVLRLVLGKKCLATMRFTSFSMVRVCTAETSFSFQLGVRLKADLLFVYVIAVLYV